MKYYFEKYFYVFFILSATSLLLLSIILNINHSFFHIELDVYLPNYLSDKSLLQIIFDPICELDVSRKYFRGREMGSFFNYIDSYLLLLLFKFKIPAFISIVNYLCILIIIVSTLYVIKRVYKNNYIITYLLILLFLSSPPIIFSGTFYRTNKVIVSVGLLLSIYLSVIIYYNKITEQNNILRYSNLGLLFSILLVTGLVDEQGLAFIVLLGFILFCIQIMFNKNIWDILAAVVASVIVVMVYRYYLGPIVFKSINNIDIIIDSINYHKLFSLKNIIKSFWLLLNYAHYLLGNINGIVGIIIYTFLFLLIAVHLAQNYDKKVILKTIVVFFLSVIYFVLILHLMTTKHKALFWEDVISYYSLPIIIIIFCIIVLLIHQMVYLNNDVKKIIIPVIALMIIFNLFSLKHYNNIIKNGHLSKGYAINSQIVIWAILSDDKTTQSLLLNIPRSRFGNRKCSEETIDIFKTKLKLK